MEYDVVVWRGTLSDGSTCYAAICPAVDHAHGQGDTEEEALVDVADTMAIYLDHKPERFKTGQEAQDAIRRLKEDLAENGTTCWVKQIALAHNRIPA